MKELLYRVLVAIVGIPLLVGAVLAGSHYFTALIVVIVLVSQWELARLLESKDIHPQRLSMWIFSLLLLGQIAYGFTAWLSALFLILLMVVFAEEMFRNRDSALMNTSGTLLAMVYPSVFLGTLLYLRLHLIDQRLPELHGGWFVFAMFAAVWICDTFAYFAGVNLGRHKLFSRVSPKKSIEGGIAGLIGAVLTFVVMRQLVLPELTLPLAMVSGMIVGVLGQLGDLVESWFKRDAAAKDSSSILPGHGGMLDRFDSLIFISPAFAVLFMLWK